MLGNSTLKKGDPPIHFALILAASLGMGFILNLPPMLILKKTLVPRLLPVKHLISIGSMYGIFSYISLILMVNVGKHTIHGSYGYFVFQNLRTSQIFMLFVFMCSLSFLQTCSIHHGFYQVKSCQFTGNTLH